MRKLQIKIPQFDLTSLFSETQELDTKSEPQPTEEQNQAQTEAQVALQQFWPKVMEEIRAIRTVILLLLSIICLAE